MIFLVLGVVAVILILFLLSSYTVIKPNQAHVVTRMSWGRKIYSPIADPEGKSVHKTGYFFIPFVMRRQIIDLTNIKLEVNDIQLHDHEMAPFTCDVVCWFHVTDPALAVERLDLEHEGGIFGSVKESLQNLVPAVAREASMKQEVLDIMRDRNTFGEQVERSVEQEIEKWGVKMIDLEINDMRDSEGSDVIKNYEKMRMTTIESTTRRQNAEQIRMAVEVEQDNLQKAEMKTAEVEEIYRKRQIEKDKAIGISAAERDLEVARSTQRANEQSVAASRTLTVGQAEIQKEAAVTIATGDAEGVRIRGEKTAEVTRLTGTAEADVISAKGTAEADVKLKMAEALKAFNESGITLEQIKAWVEVQKSKYAALPAAFANANINLSSSDPQKIFGGFGLDAEGGNSLGQFIKQLETITGKSAGQLIDDVKSTVTGKGK